jgi:hypothetical protein
MWPPPSKMVLLCAGMMLMALALKQPGYGKFAIPGWGQSHSPKEGGSAPTPQTPFCKPPQSPLEVLLTNQGDCRKP